MVKPDDDFDDDFDDAELMIDGSVVEQSDLGSPGASTPDQKCRDTRRKIEEILEARRLKQELGDLELW